MKESVYDCNNKKIQATENVVALFTKFDCASSIIYSI